MSDIDNFLNDSIDSLEEKEFEQKYGSKELNQFLRNETFIEHFKRLIKKILRWL